MNFGFMQVFPVLNAHEPRFRIQSMHFYAFPEPFITPAPESRTPAQAFNAAARLKPVDERRILGYHK